MFLQPDKYWAGFCRRIGLAELADDARFVPSSNLIANAAAATELLANTFARHDLSHWQTVLADEPGYGARSRHRGRPSTTRRSSPTGTW